MKTSMICLLLLAAVACAAPRAWEMAEEKIEMAEEKRVEKAEVKREEMAEETAVAELEDRDIGISPCYGPCPSPFPSCWFDGCYVEIDFIYVGAVCVCCRVRFIFQCYF